MLAPTLLFKNKWEGNALCQPQVWYNCPQIVWVASVHQLHTLSPLSLPFSDVRTQASGGYGWGGLSIGGQVSKNRSHHHHQAGAVLQNLEEEGNAVQSSPKTASQDPKNCIVKPYNFNEKVDCKSLDEINKVKSM